MVAKRTLVGHDGSKDADEAFETTVDFATCLGARLIPRLAFVARRK